MTRFVTVHGFRRGVGKSTLAVNLAAALVGDGHRVLLVETARGAADASGSLGVGGRAGFADVVAGTADARDVGHDATARLRATGAGRLVAVTGGIGDRPDGDDLGEATSAAFRALSAAHPSDLVVLDTAAGLTEETLTLFTVTDDLLLLVRPDRQDHHGSAVTADVARRIGVPRPHLVLTQLLGDHLAPEVRRELEEVFAIPVVAELPFAAALNEHHGDVPFVVTDPDHVWALAVRLLAARLAGAGP